MSRTTLAIAEDLLRELRELSKAENRSLTKTANQVLRAGLAALLEKRRARRQGGRFREQPVDLGKPRLDLTKALVLATQLEDAEVLRKVEHRK